ncbi:hypothetical protein HI914_01875 [Erysiphe necator]|nr:hypothetical protein HI914_01875 [Erysiphe necator]
MAESEPIVYIFTDTIKNTPYRNLLSVLNGPIVAGVGASVDPGLPRSDFHALPWDISDKVLAKIIEGTPDTPVRIAVDKRTQWRELANEDILMIAKFNINNVFKFNETIGSAYSIGKGDLNNLYKDMLCIMCITISMNYHSAETRVMTDVEVAAVNNMEITPLDLSIYTNTVHFDRAATFIVSRVHTKYQTKHVVGGSPIQASIAASIRAYYGVSANTGKNTDAKELLDAVVKGVYWATHPINEALLLPSVIRNTRIEGAYVPRNGPEPQYLPTVEYFDIRAHTAFAGTHHFLVAAAAIKALKPFGLLALLLEPARLQEVEDGLALIEAYGADLYPAARYWGLKKQSASQKTPQFLEKKTSLMGHGRR